MTSYPVALDNSSTIPIASDNVTPVNAGVVNNLRDAIIAVESELGLEPSGTYTTVRARLDALDGRFGGIQTGLATVLLNDSSVRDNVSSINFTGSVGVTVSGVDGRINVNVTGGGGSQTLAQTLVFGNLTGGTNVEFNSGSLITIDKDSGDFSISYTDTTDFSDGPAGSIYINAQENTNGTGGNIWINPGKGNVLGGGVIINGGAAGIDGSGGEINILAGPGGTNSGNGGGVFINAGDAYDHEGGSGQGGDVNIQAGFSVGEFNGGKVTIRSGRSITTGGVGSGNITIETGDDGDFTGDINITTGPASSAASHSGSIRLTTNAPVGAGNGGDIVLDVGYSNSGNPLDVGQIIYKKTGTELLNTSFATDNTAIYIRPTNVVTTGLFLGYYSISAPASHYVTGGSFFATAQDGYGFGLSAGGNTTISAGGTSDGAAGGILALFGAGALGNGIGGLAAISGSSGKSTAGGGGVACYGGDTTGLNNGGDVIIAPGTKNGAGTDGAIQLNDATTATKIKINSTGIGVFGVTPVARVSAYTVTNPVTRRSFNTTTVTLSQLAEVVGTIIADLQSYGWFQ